ncbi:MAG: adenylate cyclase, partial [Acidimicrobiia bacterium]|nr:adenylate cyclase [Acidimicrobiia bacterium]
AALDALFAPEVHDKDRLVDLLGSFVGASEPRSIEESFFAVRRTLEVLGSHRPVVMVVDDIQWAEPLLLDLLEHLAEWVSGGTVLIVCLARPEIRGIRASLAEPGRRVATVVPVEGLAPAATEELAARLLGVTQLPRDLVSRLPESTEGNPLFVRELVRMLADDGIIVRDGDSYGLTIDAEAVDVPPTIQSLLATRVERLPHDERRIVELASVVGSEFSRGALVAVAGDFSSAEVDAIIERLRRKELVESTGTYWGDEPILRFHHVLIRDAAYRRLLKGTRADLHLAIGRWTEETAGVVIGEHDATIAFHYEQTHQYRGELGPLDDETRALGNHAANLLHAAARRALESDDLAAAGSLARRALARLDERDRIRPTVLLLACEALASSDLPAARSVVAELAAVASNARLAAWVTCFESQLTVMTDPTGLLEAAAACEASALTLAKLGDMAGVAKARQIRAAALARLGRVGDCEAELDLALTAARAADDRRRVAAVLGAAPLAALWGPSPVPRAGGRCLDVIRLLRLTVRSPSVEAVSVRCQALLEALRGRFDAARAMLDTSRTTAQELGLRHGLLETELYAGVVELLADEQVTAEAHLRIAHAGLDRLGIGADAGQAAAYLARSLLVQDKLDEAEVLAVEADEHAGQNLQTTIVAKSVRAEILANRGHHDEAVALARRAVAIAGDTDLIIDHASAMAALSRVLHTAGRVDDAIEAGLEAARLWQAKGASVDVGRFDTASPLTREALRPERTAALDRDHQRWEPSDDERAALAAQSPQGRRFLALEASGTFDLDRYITMLAPDLVGDDRRHASGTSMGVGGRDDFIAGLEALRAVGGNYAQLTPLAAEGDRLLLVWGVGDSGDGNHTPFIVLLRWNDDDLIDLISVYGEDQHEHGGRARPARLGRRRYRAQLTCEASRRRRGLGDHRARCTQRGGRPGRHHERQRCFENLGFPPHPGRERQRLGDRRAHAV